MNVVLYTPDLEPITILELPFWLMEKLDEQGAIRVAVMKPPRVVNNGEALTFDMPETVTIFCEKLRWKDGTTKPILITPDDELALALKPDWLPGQRAQIQSYQKAIRHLTEQLIKAMRKD